MSDPLFVFGNARSGTNLIAAMLNAHPQVRLALDPLMPFFRALRNALIVASCDRALMDRFPSDSAFQDGYFDELGGRLLRLVLSGTLDMLLGAQDGALGDLVVKRAALESPDLARRLRGIEADSFGGFLSKIIEILADPDHAEIRWCGFKEVWTSDFIPLLARAYPRARFIINRRDPRGVIASLLALTETDATQAAHTVSYMRHWRKEAAIMDALVSDPTLAGRLLVQKYETLATDPGRGAKRLCLFLDINFDAAMLIPVLGSDRAVSGNSSFAGIGRIGEQSVERWRDLLAPEMIATIEYHCGAEMLHEGYTPVSSMPVQLSDAIRHTVLDADLRPGSWRSDSQSPRDDLAHEEMRWRMLMLPDASMLDKSEIRRYFLFNPFFNQLRAAISTAAAYPAAMG